MSKPVLVVKNLTKYYGERIALNNVSFSIGEGEIFGLIGPNGAGKTTAIKLITGLAKISSGSVTILGNDIVSNFEKAILNVGGIIENPNFYNHLSGLQNLKYFASLYGKIDMNRINYLVKVLAMQNRIKNKVKTYSLGMKQRLGIICALINKPKLLILDEPLNGLDPTGIIEMREFVKKVATEEKIAVLISSHILSEVEALCDTVGIIKNGVLIEHQNITDLQRGIKDKERFAISVSHPNFAAKIITKQYANKNVEVVGKNVILQASSQEVQDILKFLITNNIGIFGTRTVTKSLEEIYFDMVDKENKEGIL